MFLTWYGTATILIEADGKKFLIDPFFRMNKRLERPDPEEFYSADVILNTHPHFDHLCDLPEILKHTKAKIYGTPTMVKHLLSHGVDTDKKTQIITSPLKFGEVEITAYPARHVKNNLGLILKTLLIGVAKFQYARAFKILKIHKEYPMNGDIVAYEIFAEGKRILLFGSAGTIENLELPKGVDCLIFPFQGRGNMTEYSLPIIEKLQPKSVILDHFDNAFPPITGKVNTQKFVREMQKKFPGIPVTVPEYKQKIEI